MTLPVHLVELYLNGSWVDVSAYVDLADQQLTITRGRQSEQGSVTPGACSFSLQNDDGRFTIGLSSGAYYPHFVPWVQVRVSINGRREFTGYMSQAETAWDDETAGTLHTTVTCVDILGAMQMAPTVSSWANALIGALPNIDCWWPMDDQKDSLVALDVSGNHANLTAEADTDPANPLTVVDLVEFGTAGPDGLEADTQVTLKSQKDTDTGVGQHGYLRRELLPLVGSSFTILATVTLDAIPSHAELIAIDGRLELNFDGFGTLNLHEAGASVTFAPGLLFTPGVPNLIGITVSPTTVKIAGYPSLSITRPVASWSYSGSDFRLCNSLWNANATFSNVAIVDPISDATFLALRAKIVGDGVSSVTDWLNRACSEAGYPSTVTATYDRPMERPTLKGSNPFDIGSTLADAAGAMFAADRMGVPTWYDFTYCPVRVPIDAPDVNPGSVWTPDLSMYYSAVYVDGVPKWVDGAGFPKTARDLPGLLPNVDGTYALYLYNTRDVFAGPRLSQITLDLMTLPGADVTAYQGLDLKDRINLTNLPTQIPAGGVQTVEGYTVSISATAWTLTLNTAPDPRLVLGDTIAGVVGSNYRLGF